MTHVDERILVPGTYPKPNDPGKFAALAAVKPVVPTSQRMPGYEPLVAQG